MKNTSQALNKIATEVNRGTLFNLGEFKWVKIILRCSRYSAFFIWLTDMVSSKCKHFFVRQKTVSFLWWMTYGNSIIYTFGTKSLTITNAIQTVDNQLYILWGGRQCYGSYMFLTHIDYHTMIFVIQIGSIRISLFTGDRVPWSKFFPIIEMERD